jgi:type VI secretion system protein ImpH
VAGEDRPETADLGRVEAIRALEEALAGTPYRFDFYQALRRIECAHRDRPRLGTSRRPDQDPVRLGQEAFTAFAPAAISTYQPADEDRPGRLAVNFFGLLGPHGPLPLHLTEYTRDRLRNAADPTLARFLDVFHHRMLSLFFRAWANAQPAVSFDRPEADRFGFYVGSMFGLGMPSLRDRDEFPDAAKLHHAGLLACPARNPDGLKAMVEDFFGVPTSVEEFVGEWLELGSTDLCRLGTTPAESALGGSITLGSRTWERQYKFRLTLGPLGYANYERFLPGHDNPARLRALVRNFIGQELTWDVRLVLRRDQVPGLRLDGRGRLGWTTWLASAPPPGDPDDLVVSPEEVA